MNINLKQIVVSIIIFFSLNAFAENNAAKKIENYNIPDNEYYQTKKMDELENQNKELKIEIEKLNSLKIILEKFLIELSRVDENLNSKKDDSSKSDFIKSLNIYIKLNNIILNNGVNIQEEGKVAAILNGLLNQSFSLQVLGDSSQNEVIENFKSMRNYKNPKRDINL
jgi:cell division protein FtsB